MNAIIVQYIYSACIKTTTPDITILHDPWFTEGIYDGSWFHFPKVSDPLTNVGDCDLIYISHIHPDHYDGNFLKSYFRKYGRKKVIIANHSPNHLYAKMKADGIEATILVEPLLINNTMIEILPHKTGSISDIDSAIIIKLLGREKSHCVVNVNDINFEEIPNDHMLDKIKKKAGDIDILLCGYTGASPYPQTYFDIGSEKLAKEADRKKQLYFERYKKITSKLQACVNIPFAGKYILGGKLISLNLHRGNADPVEVLAFDKKAVVLADGGAEINTSTLQPTKTRLVAYDQNMIDQRCEEIKDRQMDYERLLSKDEVSQLPLKRLLVSATKNAIKKSECDINYFYSIQLPSGDFAVINANRFSSSPISFARDSSDLPESRCEITIDPRYLFGLLTYIYHWNNAEIGSQYFTRRINCSYNRKGKEFLFYLTV